MPNPFNALVAAGLVFFACVVWYGSRDPRSFR